MAIPVPPPSAPKRVMSAARAQPLAKGKEAITRERLREGAADTVLNGASILKEVYEDFRSSDRYFKYKALVILCWLGLSTTSVGVACYRGGDTNAMGARLVVAGDASKPIYMVKNDSLEAWQDVEVLVNAKWRSTAAQVDPNRELTLSPVVLFDAEGKPAPRDLQITEISVQIGEEQVALLEGGVPR